MLATTASPSPGTLGCTCHDLGEGVVRIAVAGELDLRSAPGLGRTLEMALGHATVVVLDLDALGFVDVAGGAPLRAVGRVAGRRLIVVNARPHVRKTLAAIGLHRWLKLVPPPGPDELAETLCRPQRELVRASLLARPVTGYARRSSRS